MKHYIAIDGGTTNTRVTLTHGTEPIETVRIPLGARAGIDGTDPLKRAIREAIDTLLSHASLTAKDVTRVIASGMITSEFGLCNLPHLPCPAGLAELHGAMKEVNLPDVTPIPFVFLRGVCCVGDAPLDTDMMRGEETELIGLFEEGVREALYVLPGSHSKLIEVDGKGRILRFSTMLTGEMIAALASGTILRDAVNLSVETFDPARLFDGYRYAHEEGLNAALFKVRILKNKLGESAEGCYSFFLGAILSPEIDAILRSPIARVIIGGRAQIKCATAALLRALSDREILVATDEEAGNATTRGMIRIYEYGETN